MILKIPLAWLQLSRQRVRSLVALAGIAFIVVLMFMQMGFRDALYASATQVHRTLQGDLFLLSSQYKSLTSNQSFPRQRLYQTLGFEGVATVSPLYMQFAKLKNTETGQKYSIYMMGFDPDKPIFNLPEVNQNLDQLKLPNVVFFDRKSRPEFGNIAAEFEQGNREQRIEIFSFTATQGYRVKVRGLFSLGPSFGVDGNLIMSDSTFLRIFQSAHRDPDMIDIGSITLKSDANPQQVAANLRAYLPKDVQVFTREEFSQFEKDYWTKRTPIGFTLNLMLTMGSVIGVVVVYQILYSNISNHLTAYATLKATGYTNQYLLGIVFQQALILAVLGFFPGMVIATELYNVAKDATRLPMMMSVEQRLIMLGFTVFMCMLSGLFTVNKLRSADPADIF